MTRNPRAAIPNVRLYSKRKFRHLPNKQKEILMNRPWAFYTGRAIYVVRAHRCGDPAESVMKDINHETLHAIIEVLTDWNTSALMDNTRGGWT